MLFIFDSHALDTLIAIEGVDWGRRQRAQPRDPYGFFAHLAAWGLFVQLDGAKVPGLQVKDCLEIPGDGSIYGAEGYSRYIVTPHGEIVLLAWSVDGRAAKRARVRSAGVRLSDELVP